MRRASQTHGFGQCRPAAVSVEDVPYARSGDTRIHYEISGDGSPLLFLPGLGTDIREVRALTSLLATSSTVVAVDNRGAGLSDKPDEPYSIEGMGADALAVLDAVGMAEADVLGYSMGGRIALDLAVRHPDRVHRLVLLATGARTIPTLARRALFAASPYLPVGPKPRQPAYAFKRQRAASQGYDGRRRLGQVESETLIIHGRRDRIAPPVLAQEMSDGISDSRIAWYPGGHLSPLLNPAPIADLVKNFLD